MRTSRTHHLHHLLRPLFLSESSPFKSPLLSPQDLLPFHGSPSGLHKCAPLSTLSACASESSPRSGPRPGRIRSLLFIGAFDSVSYAFPYSFTARSSAFPRFALAIGLQTSRPSSTSRRPRCALEKLYIRCFQYDHRTFCIRVRAVVSLAGL